MNDSPNGLSHFVLMHSKNDINRSDKASWVVKEKIHFLIPLSFKNVKFCIENYYNENYYKIYVQTCVTKSCDTFFFLFWANRFFIVYAWWNCHTLITEWLGPFGISVHFAIKSINSKTQSIYQSSFV